jgi:hypothetical protein
MKTIPKITWMQKKKAYFLVQQYSTRNGLIPFLSGHIEFSSESSNSVLYYQVTDYTERMILIYQLFFSDLLSKASRFISERIPDLHQTL